MSKIKIFFVVVISCYITACSKENLTSQISASDYIDTTNGSIKFSGTFLSAPGKSVSGMALILVNNNISTLALKDMNVGDGPDLHVYLSKQIKPVDFINLGLLKSTKGNQVYQLTDNINFTNYKYALIFCKQYNILFGSAELK